MVDIFIVFIFIRTKEIFILYCWAPPRREGTLQKLAYAAYIVTCTRYSLVKGERIVRFVLTTQLRASNRLTSPSLCSQPLPGVLLRLAVWYYSPRTGSAATAPHASIFGRETYRLGLGPHLLVWGPKFTRAAPGVGPNRTCINSVGRLLTSVAQYLRGAREDSRACVPCVVCDTANQIMWKRATFLFLYFLKLFFT